jgi:iron(III) transport system permease protein
MAFLYVRFTSQAQKFVVVTGKGYRPKTMSLGRWKYAGLAFVILYFLLAVGLPLVTLYWASLIPYYAGFSRELLSSVSLNNYLLFLKHPNVIMAVKNTLIVTIVSATGVTSLAVIVSWVAFRSGVKGARILDVLSVIPLAIPAVLVGLALIYVYLTLRFIPIYGTIWILVLAYVTHYMPFGTRTTNGVIVQIHKELEEAAWVSGASFLMSLVRIVIPIMIPALVSVWIWVAAHVIRELSAALLLMSYNNVVLSTLLWGYWENGKIPVAATVGVVLTTVLVFLITLLEIVRKRVQVM